MAMKLDYNAGTKESIKVEGDLGDIQIIEEVSEDDDSICAQQKELKAVNNIPNPNVGGIVQAGTVPIFGSVLVENSENVQFGNNTYFNGPVTIIQSKSGMENTSYTKTDDENTPNDYFESKSKFEVSATRRALLTWHKLALSALGVVVVGGICALILVLRTKTDDTNSSLSANTSTAKTSVEPPLISPDHLRIVPRDDWLAQPPEGAMDKLQHPAPWVIITHTATTSCFSQGECVLRVRNIQNYHIESRGWSDIGYNFLVGGDGSAYDGRGWEYVGAHTKYYNVYSIAIAFIGTFNIEEPPVQQVEACKKLIDLGVSLGMIAEDYKLFAHRQLMSTLSPGDRLFNIIKEWPHFVKNTTDLRALIPKRKA